jgi:hypothetical protein
MTIKYDPTPGVSIHNAITCAMKMAETAGERVELTFNETVLQVFPSHGSQIYDAYVKARAT